MDVSTISEADMTALTAQGYTKDDLGMLADTEVKALLHVEGSSERADPHEAAEEAQKAAAAAAEAEAARVAAESGKTTTTTATTDEDSPEHTEQAAFVPTFKAEVPADAEEQIKKLRGEEESAFKRLMDGEIDAEAYQVIKSRVEGDVDTLKTAALTASIFEQANRQTAEQAAANEWKKAENASMNSFKDEGIDYRAKPALLAAYNVNLKALGADPKNERRDASWFLTEAHRLTKADLGITTTARKVVDPTLRGVDVSELPPTLRSVPASATGAVHSDEFAHMRNLEGIALERAHAALTEAQRDRWMAE